jgi:hypothetical protein
MVKLKELVKNSIINIVCDTVDKNTIHICQKRISETTARKIKDHILILVEEVIMDRISDRIVDKVKQNIPKVSKSSVLKNLQS